MFLSLVEFCVIPFCGPARLTLPDGTAFFCARFAGFHEPAAPALRGYAGGGEQP